MAAVENKDAAPVEQPHFVESELLDMQTLRLSTSEIAQRLLTCQDVEDELPVDFITVLKELVLMEFGSCQLHQEFEQWWVPKDRSMEDSVRALAPNVPLCHKLLKKPLHNVYSVSDSTSRFHPDVNVNDLLQSKNNRRVRGLVALCDFVQIAWRRPKTVPELNLLVETIMARLDIAWPEENDLVVDRKRQVKTKIKRWSWGYGSDEDCEPEYKTEVFVTLKAKIVLPVEFPKQTRDMACCALNQLIGRLHKSYVSSARAIALVLGKVGLHQRTSQDEILRDLPTAAVAQLIAGQASVRRAFTIESADRGAFGPHIQRLIEMLEQRGQTNWNVLACLHPSFVPKATKKHVQWMLQEWCAFIVQEKSALNIQWHKGVWKCPGRGMLVPRTGSGIDSAAWNAIADGWNNAIRFLRPLAEVSGLPFPFLLKIMRLTAGDQMQWAEMEFKSLAIREKSGRKLSADEVKQLESLRRNKKMTDAAGVLATHNIHGWAAISGVMACDMWEIAHSPEVLFFAMQARADELGIEAQVTETCKAHELDPFSWLGTVRHVKAGDYVRHRNMVCGVEIGYLTPDMVEFCQSLGIFGAQKWKGK